MTDKEKYIKRAFKCYKENKKKLREASFESVRAVDYSRVMGGGNRRPDGLESALVQYIDDKTELEKQIMIVEKILWYYQLDDKTGNDKIKYIHFRWEKGYPIYRVAMECCIGTTTACAWAREILKRAAAVADLYDLW
ncbi:MAG: hypothetical protein IJV85_01225 [Clostridia bacterium]|nr:hypothetical protein [Clostridia bacterium]